MLPAAPVRFSITTGWPHLRDNQSATIRGTASAVPPAGNGTMIFTVWSGYSCACDGPQSAASTAHIISAERCRAGIDIFRPGLHMRVPRPCGLVLVFCAGEDSL